MLLLAGTSEHHVRMNCTVQRSTAASSASLIDEEIRGALARASHNHHALRHAAPTHGVPPVTLRHSWRSLDYESAVGVAFSAPPCCPAAERTCSVMSRASRPASL